MELVRIHTHTHLTEAPKSSKHSSEILALTVATLLVRSKLMQIVSKSSGKRL
jgi:hypothetical protein